MLDTDPLPIVMFGFALFSESESPKGKPRMKTGIVSEGWAAWRNSIALGAPFSDETFSTARSGSSTRQSTSALTTCSFGSPLLKTTETAGSLAANARWILINVMRSRPCRPGMKPPGTKILGFATTC
jgi:hypothetical protein